MKKNKLNAFTLAEMIVVLVVASIVIAMGFTVLNMVRKQVLLIQKNYNKKQELRLFETTFIRDFSARDTYYVEDKEQLILKNTKDSIFYVFSEGIVIRNRDTFKIEIAQKKLFLDGLETKNKTIDAIEIELSENFGRKQLFIQKTKDAAYYINN